MNKFILILFVALLSGCSSNVSYGNFISSSANQNAVNADLALDVALKINELYAAAHTKFNVAHEVNDNFGSTLIKVLREQGFAVSEYSKETLENKDGIDLFYVVDSLGDSNLLVSVHFNNSKINRVYTIKQNKAFPIGSWSVKE